MRAHMNIILSAEWNTGDWITGMRVPSIRVFQYSIIDGKKEQNFRTPHVCFCLYVSCVCLYWCGVLKGKMRAHPSISLGVNKADGLGFVILSLS